MSMLLLALLPACTPGDDEGRVVSVVGDQGWEDTSVLDTSGSHGSNVGYTGGADCGDGDTSNDPTGDDVLALDYCSRVTPEGDLPNSGPTNDSGTTSDTDIPPPPGGAPPPCGFTNLVGAFALAGTSASPVVLYCDGDADGGVRSVRLSEEDGVVNTLLSPLDCAVDPSTGTLLPLADGYGAVWSASTTQLSGEATAGVRIRQLDTDGQPVDDAWYLEDERQAWRVAVVPGDPATVLLNDYDGGLWAMPVTDDGQSVGSMQSIGADVENETGLAVPGGGVVAVCTNAGDLHLLTLDAAGALVGDVLASSGGCAWSTSPSLATNGDTLLLAWDDGIEGTAVWYQLDASTGVPVVTERTRASLGSEAAYPAATWSGTEFLVLDGSGALSFFDDAGTLLATRWHPAVVAAMGTIQALRLSVDAGVVTFAVMGLDSYPIGGGHVNSFNYVEISATPLPAL